ncbi:MAG: hypothetical protein JSR66_11855 [Proteobacteria bacterium]|nr:hypothetical protein [Pseudomonadota bacterium]
MSINRVSRSLLSSYGPLAAANSSPTAAAVANGAPDATARTEPVAPAATSTGDPVGQVETALDAVLRRARFATGSSTDGESAGSERHAPAIGLYRRVSQYSDDRSTASGLMKSWNEIVRENQFEDAGVANHVKAIAQNDALALPTRVLHLTV